MKRETSFGIIPLSLRQGEWCVLIIHQKNGNFWGFPKGHPEEGEEPLAAAQRELQEEVGLNVDSFFPFPPFTQHYTFEKEGQLIDKEVVFFAALIDERCEKKVQVEELFECKWVKLSEAAETLTHQSARQFCVQLQILLAV